ncbi:MAG: hypothetical protein JWO36_5824 [Myxococcales bacterium]|nr:hypothetical protein [Myxococcales bacterium]
MSRRTVVERKPKVIRNPKAKAKPHARATSAARANAKAKARAKSKTSAKSTSKAEAKAKANSKSTSKAQAKTSAKSKSTSKAEAKANAKRSPLAAAWLAVEKKRPHGEYSADLEPRAGLAYPDFDLAPLCPPEYTKLVRELGYRWVSGLGFLPPRWIKSESMAIGASGRAWQDVVNEREAGTHVYQFAMFASADLGDTNGFAFGPSDEGDEIVVWNIEDSLAESELGAFETWLAGEIRRLATSRGDEDEDEDEDDADAGDPLCLLAE